MKRTVLLLTRGVGPAEAQVYSFLRAAGHVVFVLDVNGQWIRGGEPTPLWMKGYRLRRGPLAASYMQRFIEATAVDRVIACGLEASAFATENLDTPFVPWLMRGSLDFSAARTALVRDFTVLMSGADRLLLDDEWEMDKAGAKGSTIPHFRAPLLIDSGERVLASGPEPKVALIHPHGMPADLMSAHQENLEAAIPAVAVQPVEVESLYRSRDLARGRDLSSVVKTRLTGFTHAVLIGNSRHHTAILGTLAADLDRLVVEETIGSGNLARDLGASHAARGLRIAVVLRDVVAGRLLPGPSRPIHPRPVTRDQDLVAVLDELMSLEVDRDFEELAVLQGTGPVDVFYSVAPLQDRTNGARPQRIRNMAEAMDRPEPAIRLYSSGGGFRRRVAALRRMFGTGRPARHFYGENSTSPIATEEAVDDLEAVLDEVRAAGGRSAWFVRDLHWLDQVDGYLDDKAMRSALVARGLDELRRIGDRADLLLAPSVASGEGFNRLLTAHGKSERRWVPLPPGVAEANVVDPVDLNPPMDGTTLLYAGGMNSVYGMDDFLGAVRGDDNPYLLDFVVRPEEADYLRQCLERSGLLGQDRVRIITVPLDLYRPQTSVCLGVVLLDSEYARFSFPYKTVSMIERGFPVLCYEDMGIAEFVRTRQVGVSCRRSPESVREGIEHLVAVGAPGLVDTRRSDSWDSRVRAVREGLSRP